jgi:hypothetical protein
MAGQISHIIAGEGALEEALGPSGLGSSPYFRFGCQGPDIFYHNQRTKPSGLHYGALAHRRRFGSLAAGAAASLAEAERSPGSPAGAYVLGLATHAAVDRKTHPFIIYFSGWIDPLDPASQRLRGCHPFLERLLDMALLERELGMRASEYGLSERLGLDSKIDESVEARLTSLWEAGLRAAYPRATASDASLSERIANALADARHFFAVSDPAAGSLGRQRDDWIRRLGPEEGRRLVSVVYPESLPAGMDPMNEAGLEWEHPGGGGRVSRASYIDLIAEGRADAARSIGLVLGFWRGELDEAELALELGEASLSLSDGEGLPLPPRFCRPLPLAEAMDAEYAKRLAGGAS